MSEITEKELMMIQVASYRTQKDMTRMTLSESITEMIQWVNAQQETDHVANSEFPKNKKENPWIDNKKCEIL